MIYALLLLVFSVCGCLLFSGCSEKDSPSMKATTSAQSFDEFVSKFNRKYSDDELAMRKEIFKKRVAEIAAHNKKGQGWSAGINQFTDRTDEELESMMNPLMAKIPKASKDAFYDRLVEDVSVHALPDSIDWVAKGFVTPVKNQGTCGSCWAFATTGLIESRYKIKYHKEISLSEQELVDCDTNDYGCQGGDPWNALEFVMNFKMCSEQSYPYEQSKAPTCRADSPKCVQVLAPGTVKQRAMVPSNDEEKLMKELLAGPVAVGIAATKEFQKYEGGIFKGDCNTNLNHAVLLVGYGEEDGVKFWKVKNSWGENWGEEGYFRLERGVGSCGTLGILSFLVIPRFDMK